MEFGLDEGQLQLQQTAARFCADRFSLDAIARRQGAPVDRVIWSEMADLGLFEFLGDDGSSGLFEGAILFEQFGLHLVPGPLVWTVAAAPLVDGAASGRLLVGGVLADDVTDGSAVVEYAADLNVVTVLGPDAVTVHRTADLPPPHVLDPLDPLTPVGRFSGLGAGDPIGGADEAARLRRLGAVLSAALLTGLAARALEVAREYALERRQFGVPIGSFQAVKHILADMYVRSALAQSATYAAAALPAGPGQHDQWRAAARAKLLAAEAALENAASAVQILGGMGFTWDMLPHYLLKRAWILEYAFGGSDDLALHLGQRLSDDMALVGQS